MADRTLTPEPGQTTALELWDRTEERSLLNLVPHDIQAAMLTASAKRPELFGQDERTLWKKLRGDNAEPSQTDNQLRMKFWFEYNAANEERRKMNMTRVYAGVCHRSYFYGRYLGCSEKIAWLVTPPLDYQLKLEESVSYGNERMRDILEMNPESFSTKPNEQLKLMELQAKIYAMLDARKHGAFTQKVEQKNMNLHVSTTDKAVAEALTGNTMSQLDTRIKELERRERKALNLTQPEVLPKEE